MPKPDNEIEAFMSNRQIESASRWIKENCQLVAANADINDLDNDFIYIRADVLHITNSAKARANFRNRDKTTGKITKIQSNSYYEKMVVLRCTESNSPLWIVIEDKHNLTQVFRGKEIPWFEERILLFEPTLVDEDMFGCRAFSMGTSFVPEREAPIPIPTTISIRAEDLVDGTYKAFYGVIPVSAMKLLKIQTYPACSTPRCRSYHHDGVCDESLIICPPRKGLKFNIKLPGLVSARMINDVHLRDLAPYFINERMIANENLVPNLVELRQTVTRILNEYANADICFRVVGWVKSGWSEEDSDHKQPRQWHVTSLRPTRPLTRRLYGDLVPPQPQIHFHGPHPAPRVQELAPTPPPAEGRRQPPPPTTQQSREQRPAGNENPTQSRHADDGNLPSTSTGTPPSADQTGMKNDDVPPSDIVSHSVGGDPCTPSNEADQIVGHDAHSLVDSSNFGRKKKNGVCGTDSEMEELFEEELKEINEMNQSKVINKPKKRKRQI